jgi:hypothetical protein
MDYDGNQNTSSFVVKAHEFRYIILLFGFIVLIEAGCQKKTEILIRLHSPIEACTTYAYIHCVYDSLGIRYIEIDTVQKSFESGIGRKENIAGTGLPVFSIRAEQSLKWILLPGAEYKMQTLTTDSLGNFCFNQSVDYSNICSLFSRGTKTHFRNVPFKIIHTDSIVSHVYEEYIP